jgi:hypothetical protein
MCAVICALGVYSAVRTLERAEALAHRLERDLRTLEVVRIDVESLSGRVRRLAGTIYSPPGVGGRPKKQPNTLDDELYGPGALDGEDVDPELQAALALQTAPPVAPGTRR